MNRNLSKKSHQKDPVREESSTKLSTGRSDQVTLSKEVQNSFRPIFSKGTSEQDKVAFWADAAKKTAISSEERIVKVENRLETGYYENPEIEQEIKETISLNLLQ
jgi:hypothetical protein